MNRARQGHVAAIDVDGNVLRIIRSRPSMVGVPVGILTSSDAVGDRHRVAILGAERYIRKPPTLEEFIDQVGRAIKELLDSTGPTTA